MAVYHTTLTIKIECMGILIGCAFTEVITGRLQQEDMDDFETLFFTQIKEGGEVIYNT